jgi:hypothetical protein
MSQVKTRFFDKSPFRSLSNMVKTLPSGEKNTPQIRPSIRAATAISLTVAISQTPTSLGSPSLD